jgi:hydrogenase nickel incorporation protein HypB
MCKECGCGQDPNSKYQTFVRDHEHSHGDHVHSHPHEGDHEHDPETGEVISSKQDKNE